MGVKVFFTFDLNFQKLNNKNFTIVQMGKSDKNQHYKALRDEFPVFVYESCSFVRTMQFLELQFVFSVKGEYYFRPEIKIPVNSSLSHQLDDKLLDYLVFHIGMVEMISYWKAFCSPCIIVKPFVLDSEQQKWWKKLFLYGLGEFFYTNEIPLPGDELISFDFPENTPNPAELITPLLEDKVLIPVGGGKDSVVSLELLKEISSHNLAIVVNHRDATRQVLKTGGFDNNRIIEVTRKIDPLLLDLNSQGFLNGHTPFSALLAFITSLCACLNGCRYIALSNESSANEPTIPGTKINHQYSKSVEFEADFRQYFADHIFHGLEYFSFLRPLNELQIGALFSGMSHYHGVFKSCNAGSKTDIWCCKCSKCLFTYIILAPFIDYDQLVRIFGNDLFADAGLIELLDQLTGQADIKPFECVGTIEEVNIALTETIHKLETEQQELPVVLKYYAAGSRYAKYADQDIWVLLAGYSKPHFLGHRFEKILLESLKNI
jgi:UDP-N-acetyl-alpha-D-muramoyl-L-alanyl-L-glutamate epimerase